MFDKLFERIVLQLILWKERVCLVVRETYMTSYLVGLLVECLVLICALSCVYTLCVRAASVL